MKKDGLKFIVSARTVSLNLPVLSTRGCCVAQRGFCVANRGWLGAQYESGLGWHIPHKSSPPCPALSSC